VTRRDGIICGEKGLKITWEAAPESTILREEKKKVDSKRKSRKRRKRYAVRTTTSGLGVVSWKERDEGRPEPSETEKWIGRKRVVRIRQKRRLVEKLSPTSAGTKTQKGKGLPDGTGSLGWDLFKLPGKRNEKGPAETT